jgi:hypothetical protein
VWSQALLYIAARCHAGFQLDHHSFTAAFESFDPDRSNACSVIEFMGLSVFLLGTAKTFSAFDPQGMGTVTLDYNKFLYAASNCR